MSDIAIAHQARSGTLKTMLLLASIVLAFFVGVIRQMPVMFVIDVGPPNAVNTITFLNTFFEVDCTAKKAG